MMTKRGKAVFSIFAAAGVLLVGWLAFMALDALPV